MKTPIVKYIVTDRETPEELEALTRRGFTLIRVHRDDGKPTEGAEGEGEA